ncbi:MAG: hypothetical protein MPI95_05865 [Nitrosopumilus sp.]|nr:hypothetical protein [Nitrosopumilus sp.]MDA7958596.1 hypothetical protein [Nitrosopumilus sp.]MDA7960930.1 hypothetical protein [Nitrosopumilus sp.]
MAGMTAKDAAIIIPLIVAVGGIAGFGVQEANSNSEEIEGVQASLDYLRDDVKEIKETTRLIYELSANVKLLCDKVEADCI